ncbi:MAG: nucleotidyltransferase family protein [Sedimentisphaerales bacterium]
MAGFNTEYIDVVILCGGMGTRLRTVVDDKPKPMAEIDKRPFIDILIGYVSAFGFQRFILCAGYKAESIQEYYKSKKYGVEILISKEQELLGTGGAVKNARFLIGSNPFLVLNGDSFLDVDLCEFVEFHLGKKALLSIALINTRDAKSYGSIEIDSSGRIVEFCEKKEESRESLINAGIYLFNREVLSLMPGGRKFSLEYDFFPKIVNKEIYGYLTDGIFIDIGTPERYTKAKQLLKDFSTIKIPNKKVAYGGKS